MKALRPGGDTNFFGVASGEAFSVKKKKERGKEKEKVELAKLGMLKQPLC